MKARLVYSTRPGRICPACGRPVAECRCASAAGRAPATDGIVRIRREVKGRNGKTVTTVSGVPVDSAALTALAADLRRLCGAGGSVKDGVIVVQGDHVDFVMAELDRRGYKVKRAGG